MDNQKDNFSVPDSPETPSERTKRLHRAWVSANKDHRKRYNKNWVEENREARSAYFRSYYAANRERCRNTHRKWVEKNKDKREQYLLKYRNKPEVKARKLITSRKLAGLPEPTRPRPKICECCGKPPSSKQGLCLDHCHETNQFRGWLCGRCNRSIGQLGDNLVGVMLAVEYLRKARAALKKVK